MDIFNIAMFGLSLVLLIASGSFLVRSLAKIANFLKVSEYVVGFILLAFATSVPELFVGIMSAVNKNTALALGTVIGSNIANITLIIGIPILIKNGYTIQSEKIGKDALYMVGLNLLPLILMLINNQISRFDGFILISAFLLYTYKVYSERKIFKKTSKNGVSHWGIILAVTIFLFSLVFLFFSADYTVKYATLIANDFALPPIIIGLFLVAIGTSLPELVAGTSASFKGHTDMSIGNIIGSVIANATLILGVTAVIHPITSNFLLFITSGVYLFVCTFIFATFMKSDKKIDWTEGFSLILLYVFFIILEFYIKGAI